MFLLVGYLYYRLRKKSDDIRRQNDKLSVELNITKEQLPNMAKSMSIDILKEQGDSFKTTTTEPLSKIVEDLKTKIEDLGKQNADNRGAFDANMQNMKEATIQLKNDYKTLSDVLKS